jgi:hypothetical protein
VIIAALGYLRAKENKLKDKEKQRMEKRSVILWRKERKRLCWI